MNTKVLEYIVAISEERSMARAAERFYLSQSSLSRHLSAIEQKLGAKLFQRRDGALALTDAGKIYVNGARAILRYQRQIDEKMDLLRHKTDVLSVAYPATLHSVISELVVPQFASQYPDCSLRIRELGSIEEISAAHENTNFDILLNQREDRHFEKAEVVELYASELVLVSATRLANRDFRLSELENECFFLHPPETAQRRLEEEIMAELAFSPKLSCVASEYFALQELVGRGFGCAFLPKQMLRHESAKPLFCTPVSTNRRLCFDAICRSSLEWDLDRKFVDGFSQITREALGEMGNAELNTAPPSH